MGLLRKFEKSILRPAVKIAAPIASQVVGNAVVPGIGGQIASNAVANYTANRAIAKTAAAAPSAAGAPAGFDQAPVPWTNADWWTTPRLQQVPPSAPGAISGRLQGIPTDKREYRKYLLEKMAKATGRKVTIREAQKIIKLLGVRAGGNVLGLSDLEAADVVLSFKARRRYGRAVLSPRRIRQAKQTLRVVASIGRQFAALRGFAPRRAPARRALGAGRGNGVSVVNVE